MLSRISRGDVAWDDIEAAVAGGFQRPAVEALLAALTARRDVAAWLFRWAVAPGLGRCVASEGPHSVTVLVFGWGGSDESQLRKVTSWWQAKGCRTMSATFCEKQIEKQLEEIKSFIQGAKVLVHAFSNNGMYLLQHLCRYSPREWRFLGIIVDSAPDVALSPALLRQVVNGCIRSL